jgi:hypothetical protein
MFIGSMSFCVVVGEGCSATFPYYHAKTQRARLSHTQEFTL